MAISFPNTSSVPVPTARGGYNVYGQADPYATSRQRPQSVEDQNWWDINNPMYWVSGYNQPGQDIRDYPTAYRDYGSALQSSTVSGSDLQNPQYYSILDPLSKSQFVAPEQYTTNFEYDPQYMNKLSGYAYATEDSPWLTMMKQQIDRNRVGATEESGRQSLGAMMQAREQLAAKGGLRSGAAERIATQGNLAGMFSKQQLAREARDKSQEASIEEARSKQALMGQLPSLELQRAGMASQIQDRNISRLLDERARENEFRLSKHQEYMRQQAASELAGAQLAASKPTGINRLFDNIVDIF